MSIEYGQKFEVKGHARNDKAMFNCPACGHHMRVSDRFRTRKTCYGCRSVFHVLRIDAENDQRTFRLIVRSIGERVPGQPSKDGEAKGDASQADKDAVMTAMAKELQALREQFQKQVKEEAARAAKEEARKLTPVTIQVTSPVPVKGKKKVDLKQRHAKYREVMDVLSAQKKVLLVGPAGSGKSTMLSQIAEDLDLAYGYLPCTRGLNEAHILGRMNMQGQYVPSEFVRLSEDPKGGVFLFDELDAADENTLLVVNEALANRRIAVPNRPRKPMCNLTEKVLLAGAANTFGTGGAEYSGRNVLDAAFLDRFCGLIVEVGYDLDRERAIAEAHDIAPLAEVLWKVRTNVMDAQIRRPVSTRALIHLGSLHKLDAERYSQSALLDRFFRGWSRQEREKACYGIDLAVLNA